MSSTNLTLCLPRGRTPENLSQPVLVESKLPTSLPPSHVLLRVERFGFSSNNVTYGALGESPHYRYFDFHPAPKTEKTAPETHGVIPVWGFGTIVASNVPSIKVGERVFGYLAMSRYLVLAVEEQGINLFNFYVPRPHLPSDRRPYNQITRCQKDPLYDPLREDETMIYRPLFWTSFWCHDWLSSSSYESATHVIISSASSKTAYCLAYLIQKWNKTRTDTQKLIVVGLTSSRNVAFTQGLALYDRILRYDQVNKLEIERSKLVYMDVAGNDDLTTEIFSHCSSSLVKAVALGMTNPAAKAPQYNNRLVPFFMVEWLHLRRTQLTTHQIAAMQKAGWDALMNECPRWIKLERIWGVRGGVQAAYMDCVAGKVAADKGLIFSMWDRDEDLNRVNVKL